MSIEIRVPALGESVTEATVGQWFKKVGDAVKADDILVELETDKVTLEIRAPAAGQLASIDVQKGTTVAVGTALGAIREGYSTAPPPKPAPHAAPANGGAMPPSPAARKALAEAGLGADDIAGSGRRGQVLKPDVSGEMVARSQDLANKAALALEAAHKAALAHDEAQKAALAEEAAHKAALARDEAQKAALAEEAAHKAAQAHKPAVHEPAAREKEQPATPLKASPAPATAVAVSPPSPMAVPAQQIRVPSAASDSGREERVKMTRLRQTIARRLKDAQNTAAMLTTFNDVDMTAVMAMRTQYKDLFEKRHGVKLGFMGFFVKACLQALKEIPSVNAEIDGTDIIYKNYYHIGVAVGTDKGLVVPVVREADRMSVAEIEARISDYGKRARDGKLGIDDLQGGTFTITNGGVYGSLMSTPILNAPQSGILGMHRIEDRAVVRGGQIVARPMMTLALSYDHRIVDGKEAVTFLVRVKECLEDPHRFILDL